MFGLVGEGQEERSSLCRDQHRRGMQWGYHNLGDGQTVRDTVVVARGIDGNGCGELQLRRQHRHVWIAVARTTGTRARRVRVVAMEEGAVVCVEGIKAFVEEGEGGDTQSLPKIHCIQGRQGTYQFK